MNRGLKPICAVLAGVMVSSVFLFASVPARADGGSGYEGEGHRHGMVVHGHWRGHAGWHHGMLHRLLRHQQELGLTDEQIGKLKALALDQDRAKIRAHADVMVAERELKTLVWDEKAELPSIQAKLKECASLEAAVRFLGVKSRRELLAVLTPEQRDKLKVLRAQMRTGHDDQASIEETKPVALEDDAGGSQAG